MEVTLNQAEVKLAEYLAEQRYRFARKNGIPDGKMGPQNNRETDQDGVGAEIAFCKLFNVFPDTEIGVFADADAYTLKLGSVDVKTTRCLHGRLLAVKGKVNKVHPDAYALMIGKLPTFRFVGWASADELLNDSNIIDLGHGPGFGMDQSDLNPL